MPHTFILHIVERLVECLAIDYFQRPKKSSNLTKTAIKLTYILLFLKLLLKKKKIPYLRLLLIASRNYIVNRFGHGLGTFLIVIGNTTSITRKEFQLNPCSCISFSILILPYEINLKLNKNYWFNYLFILAPSIILMVL